MPSTIKERIKKHVLRSKKYYPGEKNRIRSIFFSLLGDQKRPLKSVFGLYLGIYRISRVVLIIIFALLIEFFTLEYNLGCRNEILFFRRFASAWCTQKQSKFKYSFPKLMMYSILQNSLSRAKMIMGTNRESRYLPRYRPKTDFKGLF